MTLEANQSKGAARPLALMLVGPPGAGKGTQARLLVERYGLIQISTGDMLRDAGAHESALGREAAARMARGELVADDVIVALVEERLEAEDARAGFLFDGFPRTIPQAAALEDWMERKGWSLDCVIVLDVPAEVVVQRNCGRRWCPQCQETYHLQNRPPAHDDLCDRCGGELVQPCRRPRGRDPPALWRSTTPRRRR